jgi:hypothetical protein
VRAKRDGIIGAKDTFFEDAPNSETPTRAKSDRPLPWREIDKARYCTLVDPAGKIVARHEPAHTLTRDFKAEWDGTAQQEKAKQGDKARSEKV